MAKNTQTFITDDIDGSADAQEINFSYRGTQYVIDLGEKNLAKLDKALAPFIGKATKVGGRKKTAANGVKRNDLADVRAWAKSNGHDVSERGRIPGAVLEAYDAAN